MTRKLTFAQAAESVRAIGYELIKYAGSSNAYGSVFKCQCGHSWSAKHNNVVSSNKTGCPECARRSARMDAEGIRAALAAKGVNLLTIDGEIRGQGTLITTSCAHGHVRHCKLGTIIYANKPCPECSKRKRAVDVDAYSERLQAIGCTLVSWSGTTRAKAVIRCNCGGVWESRLNSVLREESHCPQCYEGGLRGDKPAVFYIYELRKGRRVRYGYGISGMFARRNAEHSRNAAKHGWSIQLERIVQYEKGCDALRIEQRIKETIPVPKGMFPGFKTECVEPKDLQRLVAML